MIFGDFDLCEDSIISPNLWHIADVMVTLEKYLNIQNFLNARGECTYSTVYLPYNKCINTFSKASSGSVTEADVVSGCIL